MFHLSGGDKNLASNSVVSADQNVAAEAISLLDLNPDLEDILTDNNWFITCAQNYIFSGASITRIAKSIAQNLKMKRLLPFL